MAEEWVCDECGYVGTDATKICPECGSKLVSVGDYDDDLAKSDERYSKDELKTEITDKEPDFVDEDDEADADNEKVQQDKDD